MKILINCYSQLFQEKEEKHCSPEQTFKEDAM
jgi:hypothetical protein